LIAFCKSFDKLFDGLGLLTGWGVL